MPRKKKIASEKWNYRNAWYPPYLSLGEQPEFQRFLEHYQGKNIWGGCCLTGQELRAGVTQGRRYEWPRFTHSWLCECACKQQYSSNLRSSTSSQYNKRLWFILLANMLDLSWVILVVWKLRWMWASSWVYKQAFLQCVCDARDQFFLSEEATAKHLFPIS